MRALIPRRVAGILAAALLVVLSACGEEIAAPPPAPVPALPPKPAPPPGPSPEQIDAALRDLDAASTPSRVNALGLLRKAEFDWRELTHLGLRAARLNRDVGLLADLLSESPADVLPHVLHRITHAAAMQRKRICRALARPRDHVDATLAVLLVRALIDPESTVRHEARLAIRTVDPISDVVVEAHLEAYPRFPDGSVRYLSPSLLLGPGSRDPETPFRRAFLAALEAEAARFGHDTVEIIERFRAVLAGKIAPWPPQRQSRATLRSNRVAMAETLVRTETVESLEKLLDRSGYLPAVALALGLIGFDASDAAPKLVTVWRAQLPREKMDSNAKGSTEDIRERSRFDWTQYKGNSPSAEVAWALLRMGNRSPRVTRELISLLDRPLPPFDERMLELALKMLVLRGESAEHLWKHAISTAKDNLNVNGRALELLAWCHAEDRRVFLGRIAVLEKSYRLPRGKRGAMRRGRREFEAMERNEMEERESLLAKLRAFVLGL